MAIVQRTHAILVSVESHLLTYTYVSLPACNFAAPRTNRRAADPCPQASADQEA